jgi:GNAT superfamily N-acetyltransferase
LRSVSAIGQPGAQATVRRYRPSDSRAATSLLYDSAGGTYDRYAGSAKLAKRAIARALERPGTTASADVVWVAELDGRVAGTMAAMPFDEWTPRAHAFLAATLRSIPPWRWPRTLWIYRASGRTAPEPPTGCLYVDSLATRATDRRRGVARALLAAAEAHARALNLEAVALDTWARNRSARALYLGAGFEEVAYVPECGALPAGVSLLKQLA